MPAGPLLDAIRTVVADRGVPPTELFAAPADRALFEYWTLQAERSGGKGRAATVEPVRAGQLAALAGLDPHEMFRTIGPDETATDRYADAPRHAGKKVERRRPGIDLTVSAAKSVSVLFGLGDRDGQRAHRIATDGWIVAAFEHHTSREEDPQLHTHLVHANLLRGADGSPHWTRGRCTGRRAPTSTTRPCGPSSRERSACSGRPWTRASPRSPASPSRCDGGVPGH